MSQSTLHALARIALKSHYELLGILPRIACPSPHRLGWGLDFQEASSKVHLTVDPTGMLTLDAENENGRYLLQVPVSTLDFEGQKIKLQLFEAGGTQQTHELQGKDILSFAAPEAFKSLHAKSLELLEKLFNFKQTANASKQAEGSTPAPAEPNASESLEKLVDREWVISRDNQKDLRFTGRLLVQGYTPYRNGRKFTYSVFQTKGKKWVAIKQGSSLRLTERDTCEVKVMSSSQELFEFFGYSNLAKQIYSELGLTAEAYESVD